MPVTGSRLQGKVNLPFSVSIMVFKSSRAEPLRWSSEAAYVIGDKPICLSMRQGGGEWDFLTGIVTRIVWLARTKDLRVQATILMRSETADEACNWVIRSVRRAVH